MHALSSDTDLRPPLPAVAGDLAAAHLARSARGRRPGLLGIPPERLLDITEKACVRIDECRNEMGLRFGQPLADQGTWAWERQVARTMYQGNMDHRRVLGGIFLENNWSLNLPARIVRLLAAQHAGDLVGGDPFCAAMPEKLDDPGQTRLARQVEKRIQDEFAASNFRACMAESIRVALTEGERPIKITYDTDVTMFVGDATVMVAPPRSANAKLRTANTDLQSSDSDLRSPAPALASVAPGQPIRTPTGQYIFPKDEIVPQCVDAGGGELAVFDPEQPVPPGTASIELRLRKEPGCVLQRFAYPADAQALAAFAPAYRLVKNLPQTITHYRRLNASGLFCEDFLYPIKCTSLQDPSCDIMVHCYDEPLDSAAARYRNAGYLEQYLPLRETGPVAQASQPILEAGENYHASSRRMVNWHETYFRTRVREDDPHEAWLFLVIDYQHRVPIYAEYLGNMRMKRPPFVLLRGVESEPGRAYGVGVYRKSADRALAIDVWFNRAALKSSKSGSITFQHENGIKAEYQGQQLRIGGKEVYKIPATAGEDFGPSHPPVFRVNLNEMSEQEFQLMEKMVQAEVLEFGIVSAADGASADLNASGTATGIRNIERTGNILQRATEDMMADDITAALDLAVDAILENADLDSLRGTSGVDALAALNRDEIRMLPRDVRILLTKAKGEENLATNQQASQIVESYYAKPLWLRKKVRAFVVNQLKSLYVADADEVIEDPSEDDLAQEGQASGGGASPRESLHLALKDLGPLTPEERAQALKLFGITATSPETQAPAGDGPVPAGVGGSNPSASGATAAGVA